MIREVQRPQALAIVTITPEVVRAMAFSAPDAAVDYSVLIPGRLRRELCDLLMWPEFDVGRFLTCRQLNAAVELAREMNMPNSPSPTPPPSPPQTPPPVTTLPAVTTTAPPAPGEPRRDVYLQSCQDFIEGLIAASGTRWSRPFSFEELSAQKVLDVSVMNWFASFGSGDDDAPVLFQAFHRPRYGWYTIRPYPQPVFVDLTVD